MGVFVVMSLEGQLHAVREPVQGLPKQVMKCLAKGADEEVCVARYSSTRRLSEKDGMMGGLSLRSSGTGPRCPSTPPDLRCVYQRHDRVTSRLGHRPES